MTTQEHIKVLIADDHKMMLDGLHSLLSTEANIQIVGQAMNGLQVLEILHQQPVDVAVIDIGMPEMDGYETVLKMKQLAPATRVIILSLHKDEKHVGRLLKAGVSGYIIKDRGGEELVKAINEVARGNEYFDNEVQKVSLKAMQNKNAGPDKELRFTAKEEEVLHYIADGLSSKQIGEKLFIAESTVETHRKNLLGKTGLPNSKHLLKWAIEKGYGKSPLR